MKKMRFAVAVLLVSLLTSCASFRGPQNLTNGDSFRTHRLEDVARVIVSDNGETLFEITDHDTIESLWTASSRAEFVDHAFIIMAGRFADVAYMDKNGNVLADCSQMNACRQVVQYTRINNKSEMLVGESREHAQLIYDLVREHAPEHFATLREISRRFDYDLEAVLFECADATKYREKDRSPNLQ